LCELYNIASSPLHIRQLCCLDRFWQMAGHALCSAALRGMGVSNYVMTKNRKIQRELTGSFTARYYDLHPDVDAVKCRALTPACRVQRSYAACMHASLMCLRLYVWSGMLNSACYLCYVH